MLSTSLAGPGPAMTLKGRLAETIRLQSANVYNNQTRQQLTKKELKELKKMNETREMHTLMGRTRQGNHLKYLGAALGGLG